MTQTVPQSPSAGQQPEYREEFHVVGKQLVTTVEQLLHEGNVRRIIIKHEGHTLLEIPLTIGLVGVLVAPMLAAVGAIGAAVTNCTIEVIRTVPPEQTGGPPSAQEISQPPFTIFSGQSYSIAHMFLLIQGNNAAITSPGECSGVVALKGNPLLCMNFSPGPHFSFKRVYERTG